jgi:hypothetical protein
MKIITLTYALILLFLGQTYAQKLTYHPENKPTKAETALDTQVKACTAEGANLPTDFSLADWSAILHYYNTKMIQRLSSENVDKIANERKTVEAISILSATCPALAKAKDEITAIKKIFDKKIMDESNEANTGVFDDDERKVKMEKGDAEDLLKQLEKFRKKLAITRVVIRIQN